MDGLIGKVTATPGQWDTLAAIRLEGTRGETLHAPRGGRR